MDLEEIEIEPAAELVLHDIADEFICGGKDIYETLRLAYRLGYHAADSEQYIKAADNLLDQWEGYDTRRKG